MKNFLLILCMTALFSCAKSVDSQVDQQQIINDTANNLSVNLGETVLKAAMEPVVTCYSGDSSEAQKPCDIFVNITFTLSRPVNRYVQVTIQRNNIVEVEIDSADVQHKPTSIVPGGATEVFVLAPNQTNITFKSRFTNENNIHVPEGRFRIADASLFDMVE